MMAKIKELGIKAVIAAAANEVQKETLDEAKKKYKNKLIQLKQAKKVVSNIKRELEDLELELINDLS